MEVQSVLFDNKIYNTGMARLFLKRHLLVPIKLPDKTTNTYRFRIREPSYRHYKNCANIYRS